MFAVVQIGSSQYKVSEGDVIKPYRIDEEVGKDVNLDKVLLISKDSDVKVGQPYIKGAKITAKVINHLLSDKVTAFKYRRRKDSFIKKCNRQKLTALSISKISS